MGRQAAVPSALRERISGLPDQPGVYLFKDAHGALLYVGKAVSLRKRVSSYVQRSTILPPRIARMMKHVAEVEVRIVPSEAEALLLEAQLIKTHKPRYNVAFRDDKSYPMLKVTDEPFPRLLVVRRHAPPPKGLVGGQADLPAAPGAAQAGGGRYFGPYTDAGAMHEAVRFLRRVFPLRTCARFPKTPCLEYHLGQCLAPCAKYIAAARYDRIVGDLVAFLQGERDELLRELARRMERSARAERFEDAARIRDQIEALTSVIVAKEKSLAAGPLEQLQAALKLPAVPRRIEAFDISNIFGAFAVGSMVVFTDGKPHKAHYRRFKIETVQGIDDYRMMREVVRRRYSGSLAASLPLPDLVLVDGGRGQLRAACEELAALALSIPAMGLAKRFEHIFLPGEEEPIVLLPTSPVLHLAQHIRDEAHRFAVTYHRLLRRKAMHVKPPTRGAR